MKELKKLHDEAMELSEKAFLSKREGNIALANELSKKAFALESRAAQILKDKPEIEPTRSILYRSAASLAIECGENTQAIGLIEEALNGNPPAEIATELKTLSKVSADNLKKSPDNRTKSRYHYMETARDKAEQLKDKEQPTKEAAPRQRKSGYLGKDAIADMLTRIRNAIKAQHSRVDIPGSKLKLEIARILKEEGYINNFVTKGEGAKFVIRIFLRYDTKGASSITRATRIGKTLRGHGLRATRPDRRLLVNKTDSTKYLNRYQVNIFNTRSESILRDVKAQLERNSAGKNVLKYEN